MKKWTSALLALVMIAGLGACGKKTDASQGGDSQSGTSGTSSGTDTEFAKKMADMYEGKGDYSNQPIAVMETSEGTIKIRLFPSVAPKAVENFVGLAKNGYYEGVTFHRVIQDFMIQGGDPTATGAGGESLFGTEFEDEFDDLAHNFRGSLSMANAGPATNGSQFFIVQRETAFTSDEEAQQLLKAMYFQRELSQAEQQFLKAQKENKSQQELEELADRLNQELAEKQEAEVPEAYAKQMQPVMEKYRELGGTPHLDYKHTVFGFVFEGMDVVDKIASVKTEAGDKPVQDVLINKITIEGE